MIYPNIRYGNPAALRAYAAGIPIKTLARQLRRHPRTVADWLTGQRKMPWWVPELLQLRHEAAIRSLREMGVRLDLRAVSCPQPGYAVAPQRLPADPFGASGQHEPEPHALSGRRKSGFSG